VVSAPKKMVGMHNQSHSSSSLNESSRQSIRSLNNNRGTGDYSIVWEDSDTSESVEYSWDNDGWGRPMEGYWRKKNGEQVLIRDMEDGHLINAMKFLRKTHGEASVFWPIFKELFKEAERRGIDDRSEWDS
jgi:hypothetical protein